jgi:hypothetical protein
VDRQSVRRLAVAGTWYAGDPAELARDVDGYLDRAEDTPARDARALVVPHAGLMFSGWVAAYAYRAIAGRRYDTVALVGPSHFVGFDGVAVWPDGLFESPFGPVPIDRTGTDALRRASSVVRTYTAAHLREHSLELQLPFVCRVLPAVPIVPLLMGFQERRTIVDLASALATAFAGRAVLLVASTDLSHYFPADRAAMLDRRVVEYLDRFDSDGLLSEFERYPPDDRGRSVGCGIGPAIAVMQAARALGATRARVLKYADSSAVSGDRSTVVGYAAAVIEGP